MSKGSEITHRLGFAGHSPDVAAGARQVPPGALHLERRRRKIHVSSLSLATAMSYIKYSQNFTQNTPKNYTGEIKHWQIYTVDLLQITILDVCVVLPSLYPFSTQLPSAPQWSSGSCPRHPSDQDGKEQFKHAII